MRIYPYPFRLVPKQNRFKKYDIIEARLEPPREYDPRPESFRLSDPQSVSRIDHLDTRGNWAARMRHILPTVVPSVQAFQAAMFPDSTRWGPSIRPVQIVPESARLICHHRGETWSEEELAKLSKAQDRVQGSLFRDDEVANAFQVLRKVPYEFRLEFQDLTGESYNLMILDWEIAQLYFNCRRSAGSDIEALELVRVRIEEQICCPENDVYLVVGNVHHRFWQPGNIAVDGFIYPKRQLQGRLF